MEETALSPEPEDLIREVNSHRHQVWLAIGRAFLAVERSQEVVEKARDRIELRTEEAKIRNAEVEEARAILRRAGLLKD